jgi:hypothetical protein
VRTNYKQDIAGAFQRSTDRDEARGVQSIHEIGMRPPTFLLPSSGSESFQAAPHDRMTANRRSTDAPSFVASLTNVASLTKLIQLAEHRRQHPETGTPHHRRATL